MYIPTLFHSKIVEHIWEAHTTHASSSCPQIKCCLLSTCQFPANLWPRCCDWLFSGLVELPSYLVGCFAMDRIGRKKTCAPALLLAGIACMLIIVVPAVRIWECVWKYLPEMKSSWRSGGTSLKNLFTFSNGRCWYLIASWVICLQVVCLSPSFHTLH